MKAHGTIKKLIDTFLTNHGNFPQGHPKYRQAGLLNVVLVLVFLNCAGFFIIDLQIPDMMLAASINGVTALMSLVLFWYFRRTNHLARSSTMSVILIMVALLSFLTVMKSQNNAFVWIAVFPPLAYFLSGSRRGAVFTSLFLLCVTVFIGTQYQTWSPSSFRLESTLNIIGTIVIVMFLSHYHEDSQEKAEKFLEVANQKLELLASLDQMTGLYNKAAIYEFLRVEVERANRYGRPLSLLLIDVDHFKYINDLHGHLAGDKALNEIAAMMVNCSRTIDLIGRIGGDEFIIIAPDTSREGVAALAERIQYGTGTLNQSECGPITLSIGVTSYRMEESTEELIERCDQALYQAKANGRARTEAK